MSRDTTQVGRRRCTMRVVRENENDELVLVYEPEIALDGRVLVFESTKGTQRVTHFPISWRDLRDTELLQLRPADL